MITVPVAWTRARQWEYCAQSRRGTWSLPKIEAELLGMVTVSEFEDGPHLAFVATWLAPRASFSPRNGQRREKPSEQWQAAVADVSALVWNAAARGRRRIYFRGTVAGWSNTEAACHSSVQRLLFTTSGRIQGPRDA